MEEKWFAVRTPFKREKLALADLTRKGLVCYLPLLHDVRRYQKKVREVDIPLIRSYLFVCLNESAYHTVVTCPFVSGFVRFGEEIVSVPEEEMTSSAALLAKPGCVMPKRVFSMKEKWLRSSAETDGNYRHLNRTKGQNQVAIALNVIGYSPVMDIDPIHLRRVKGRG
ncbi:MAG: UpxY family transcription antiterminator [Saprospiraceae bacterium]|nr:UpxY family transcription antiterminator [Saprospiraceae bacterium]